ncbi:PREDICTED: oncostatin-M-specific receptor subunit beta [Elephantulus edwardii]|uniref:oncostatin-M-specific receptor subunit beta n=1 Tax=Elephantulus edwardii TaxID=28737 RepID=UPI0003F0E906|nr:PREDICTED: oncostatin-M-specific receptor subunit beta [Elephantulus edwardii]
MILLNNFSESLKLTPESLKISTNFSQQRLDFQWHVNNSLYRQRIEMVFQIQISRIVTSNVIWVGNYSASVKGTQALHWSWESELPLECATHYVRIRSLVDDARFPKPRAWSPWSSWEKDSVKPSLGKGYFLIFPQDKIVEEGSNVTFCSISRSNQNNFSCFWEKKQMRREQLTADVSTYTVHQVPYIGPTGGTVFCEMKPGDDPTGSILFVSQILEEPKNFSCETRDLKNLVCTWNPGRNTGLLKTTPIYTLFEAFSQKRKVCEHNNRCTWQVTENFQKQYNFTLVAENILRKRSANSVFHLVHRGFLPSFLSLYIEVFNQVQEVLGDCFLNIALLLFSGT